MVTVVVGGTAPAGEGGDATAQCRVVTLADGADAPLDVTFPVPTPDAPLAPGKPAWANYVKGVVQHYKGILYADQSVQESVWINFSSSVRNVGLVLFHCRLA